MKRHDKQVIISRNDNGWWAANLEPKMKDGNSHKINPMVRGVESRKKMLELILGLGYRPENIVEGILRK